MLTALALAGCATAYKNQGLGGSFASTQLEAKVLTVTFKGNGFTEQDKVNKFALLRSAEIALENGFQYFTIVDAQQYPKNSAYSAPTTPTKSLEAKADGSTSAYVNMTMYKQKTEGKTAVARPGGQTNSESEQGTSITIACFSEKPKGFSYNAGSIVKSHRQKKE